MVKHTQTIRRRLPTNCLNVFGHFVGLALKALIAYENRIRFHSKTVFVFRPVQLLALTESIQSPDKDLRCCVFRL